MNNIRKQEESQMDNLCGTHYSSNDTSEKDDLSFMPDYQIGAGDKVVVNEKDFLDLTLPLKNGSHHDVREYRIYYQHLIVTLIDGRCMGLRSPEQLVTYDGEMESPTSLLFKNNDLYIEIQIDRDGEVGSKYIAGIKNDLMDVA